MPSLTLNVNGRDHTVTVQNKDMPLLWVLRGELQIWELATAGTAQWFVGDRFDSPVAFFYEVLSEQVRPDLARELYARAELLK